MLASVTVVTFQGNRCVPTQLLRLTTCVSCCHGRAAVRASPTRPNGLQATSVVVRPGQRGNQTGGLDGHIPALRQLVKVLWRCIRMSQSQTNLIAATVNHGSPSSHGPPNGHIHSGVSLFAETTARRSFSDCVWQPNRHKRERLPARHVLRHSSSGMAT